MALFLAKFDKTKRITEHTRLPFSDRYITGTPRYFFREWDCSMTSMLAYYTECPTPSLEYSEAVGGAPAEILHLKNDDGDNQTPMGPFPTVILDEIFSNLHPMDLVHSASTVCKAWNWMAFNPRFWKEAVVTLSDSDRNYGAKIFLEKVSDSLERLAIIVRYPSRRAYSVVGILPKKMPKMSHLEIEYRPNVSVDDALWPHFAGDAHMPLATPPASYLFPRDARVADDLHNPIRFPGDFLLVDSCMPQLRCLILKNLFIRISDRRCGYMLNLEVLNGPRNAFPQLESFQYAGGQNVGGRTIRAKFVEEFCVERPTVQQIRFNDGVLRNVMKQTHLHLGNLRGFFTGMFILEEDIEEFSLLTNLVVLDISKGAYFPEELLPIRELHHLEHLHIGGLCIRNDGQGVSAFRDLFRTPSLPAQFPSGLKFLSLDVEAEVYTSQCVDEITANCPQLRVLGVTGRGMVYRDIAKCFHSMRHLVGLRARSLAELVAALEGDLPILDDLPDRLQYVRVSERKEEISGDSAKAQIWIESVLKKLPNTIVEFDDNKILTYRREEERIVIMPDVDGWRARNAVALIQGSCCLN